MVVTQHTADSRSTASGRSRPASAGRRAANRSLRIVVVLDELGRELGKIVSPIAEQVLGRERGTVYLTRS
jgi:hypothetical protein